LACLRGRLAHLFLISGNSEKNGKEKSEIRRLDFLSLRMYYLLDSNILIDLLSGREETYSWIMDQRKSGSILSVSFISKVEVLSLGGLKDSQIKQIKDFLNTFEINRFISNDILDTVAALRRKKLLTLGDAMIAATAIVGRMTLVTNDQKLLRVAKDLVPVLSI